MGCLLAFAYGVVVFFVGMAGYSLGVGDSQLSPHGSDTMKFVAFGLLGLTIGLVGLAFAKALGVGDRLPGRPGQLIGLAVFGCAMLLPGLGGVVMTENAADANAHERVLAALSLVEEFRSTHQGREPSGAECVKAWKAKRPDDYQMSPWGGKTGPGAPDGMVAGKPLTGDRPSPETPANAPGDAGGLAPDPARAGAMIFVPIGTGSKGPWRALVATSTGTPVVVRYYAVGIYSKSGTPWWDVNGGR